MMPHTKKDVWDLAISVFTAVGAIGTLVAVIVSIHIATAQISEQRDEARVQHLVEEVRRFDEEPLRQRRASLARQRMDRKTESLRRLDPEAPPTEMWDVLNACDHIGLLAKRGYLNVADIWNDMAYWIFNIYADAKPAIVEDRKKYPASMANCTWLIDEMTPIEQREDHGADLNPSADSIYDFYDSESSATGAMSNDHVK